MSEIISRIRQVIDYKKISERKFCSEIGVSNGFLNKVSDVGTSKLLKIISTYPEINPEWLLTGKGEMIECNEVDIKGSPANDVIDKLRKGLTWLAVSSYSKQNNSDFAYNSFADLAEVFDIGGGYISMLQETLENELTRALLNDIKGKPISNEGNYIIDSVKAGKIIDKYIPLFEELKKISLELMQAISYNDVSHGE